MTLLDFEELAAYWAEYPPLHISLAAYLGLGKQSRTRVPSAKPGEAPSRYPQKTGSAAGTILAGLGPGFVSGDVHAGLPPVVLDFSELQRKAIAGG